jgi:hypothetical protein
MLNPERTTRNECQDESNVALEGHLLFLNFVFSTPSQAAMRRAS